MSSGAAWPGGTSLTLSSQTSPLSPPPEGLNPDGDSIPTFPKHPKPLRPRQGRAVSQVLKGDAASQTKARGSCRKSLNTKDVRPTKAYSSWTLSPSAHTPEPMQELVKNRVFPSKKGSKRSPGLDGGGCGLTPGSNLIGGACGKADFPFQAESHTCCLRRSTVQEGGSSR